MELAELAVAALIGLLAGLAGARVSRRHHGFPRWLVVLVGAGAALAGTAGAASVREEPLGPVLAVLAPLFFAGIALTAMVVRAPHPADRRR